MFDWIKRLLHKKPLIKNAAENQYLIEKYKDFDKIIATNFSMKDSTGKDILLDGIVVPLKIDNRQQCSMTDDQGNTSQCAAYSICNIIEALIWKKTGKLVNLNPEQVYAKAKQLDKEVSTDGTYLECAIKAAIDLSGFGKQSKDIKIGFVYNRHDDQTVFCIKRLLHKYSFLHMGFLIDDAWYCASNDKYIINRGNIEQGAHAIVACGYDLDYLYIQNSWSKRWGSLGFAMIPWNIVKDKFLYCCYIENFNI